VPHGPWARYGDNNTFILAKRKSDKSLAEGPKLGGMTIVP
jgi:hypothetical protein